MAVSFIGLREPFHPSLLLSKRFFFLDTIEKYAYRVGDSPLKYNERPSFFATFSFRVEARQ